MLPVTKRKPAGAQACQGVTQFMCQVSPRVFPGRRRKGKPWQPGFPHVVQFKTRRGRYSLRHVPGATPSAITSDHMRGGCQGRRPNSGTKNRNSMKTLVSKANCPKLGGQAAPGCRRRGLFWFSSGWSWWSSVYILLSKLKVLSPLKVF